MKASKALRTVVRSSDLTALEISRRIGRKDNYVSSLLSRGSCPTAETLATIAGMCGWKLCLVGPDREIEIDGWKVKARKSIPIDSRPVEEPRGEEPAGEEPVDGEGEPTEPLAD